MEIVVEKPVKRLDAYLAEITDYSRSKIQKLIKDDLVLVNNKKTSASASLKEGDTIKYTLVEEEIINILPEKMELDIVFEDEFLAVINKKSGVVVHPAVGNYQHTLVNGLMYHFNQISKEKSIRPGIVHRLDKDTSGLMVVAKTEEVLEKLSNMIKNKEIKRHYLALVEGLIAPQSATIDAPIGRDQNNREKMAVTDINSKEAITHIKVLQKYSKYTLIECILDTGRTHQIRVHLSYINHPVVNDPIYNKKKSTPFGQLLHSKSIDFIHPITKEHLHFEQTPPKEFNEYLENLN